ncbi:MAG: succinate dehydrogenase (quinone) flavoprotein subunit [Parachlamydiales bacterium]|nr:succinate dehydrogenase (quinone) flavoprotein subunit [Parachlamydiales bacterium]
MKKVIVIGAGLAGLSCALKLASQNIFVYLVSLLPARRSHSVCAQGGINAAIEKDDSPIIHAYETIKGGDFLADQPPVLEMCLNAPSIIKMMDRFGCLFNRDSSGNIDFRRFGGSLYKRTVYSSSTTGQQLMYSLDEQVRYFEEKNLVKRLEHHEFVKLMKDDFDIAKGAVIQDIYDLKLFAIKADAVVIATGGLGLIFKKSTNSYQCTGSANATLFSQGMKLANSEFIQIHPTAIPGEDKLRLISESLRGEGGRIWVYGDETKKIKFPDGSIQACGEKNKPWYFLEQMYPEYKNLVPRDIAARAILDVCDLGLGVDSAQSVYLDVTHLDDKTLKKLDAPIDIYKKFTGQDPKKVPMKIFPAVHYSMGGAWVDFPSILDPNREKRFRQMTNISGLFNIGESDYLFHGANRLGANALLSCIYSGLVCGKEIFKFLDFQNSLDIQDKVIEKVLKDEEKKQKVLLSQNGKENIFDLHETMAKNLLKNVTVRRDNQNLEKTLNLLDEIESRSKNIYLDDKNYSLNQTYLFARQLPYMILLAKAITKSALLRNESRGCHFKQNFPKRDDENFLKTTIATYNKNNNGIDISYQDVDTRHFDPQTRVYDKKQTVPKVKNFNNKFEEVV